MKKRNLPLVWMIMLGVMAVLHACKGATGPAGVAGTPGTPYTPPAALCSAPSTLGSPVTTGSTSYTANYLFASPVTVTTATTAINIASYSQAAAVTGQIRLGIYNDAAGLPGNLVVQADAVNLQAAGWTTADMSDTYLPVGTYWVAMQLTNNTVMTTGGAPATYRYVSREWAVMPDAFPTSSPGTSTVRIPVIAQTCP